MKTILKTVSSAVLIALTLAGSNAFAASGDDETYKNLTLEERLYMFDGYGAKWGFDVGNDGLWFVADRPVPDTYDAAMKIRNVAAANTLVVGGIDDQNKTAGYVGIGTDTPQAKLDIQFSGENTTADGSSILTLLSANNTASGKSSDVGFGLKNVQKNFQWNFRTIGYEEGFSATKTGTHGGEFIVKSPTNDFHDAKMIVGGVTIFENGHLVTASSRSLKTNIEPLDTQAALEAFHKLQPVRYEYKAHKGEKVVGFIAEDVPELIAMPSRKSFDAAEVVALLTKVVQEQDKQLKAQAEKIEKLENMQKRLSKIENLLTNLALDANTKNTSHTVSLK